MSARYLPTRLDGIATIIDADGRVLSPEEKDEMVRRVIAYDVQRLAVDHVITRIQQNPRLAYYIDPATRTFELLTAAQALASGWDVTQLRARVAKNMRYEAPASEDELVEALAFCRSVINEHLTMEQSGRMAIEKADAALVNVTHKRVSDGLMESMTDEAIAAYRIAEETGDEQALRAYDSGISRMPSPHDLHSELVPNLLEQRRDVVVIGDADDTTASRALNEVNLKS